MVMPIKNLTFFFMLPLGSNMSTATPKMLMMAKLMIHLPIAGFTLFITSLKMCRDQRRYKATSSW